MLTYFSQCIYCITECTCSAKNWDSSLNRIKWDPYFWTPEGVCQTCFHVCNFSVLSCKLTVAHTHRGTADSHAWLELNHRDVINAGRCAAAFQQCILLDSLWRAISIDIYTGFSCSLPATIRPIPVNLSNINPLLAWCFFSTFFFGSVSLFPSITLIPVHGNLSSLFPRQTLTTRATLSPMHLLGSNVNTAVNTNNSQRVKQQLGHVDWQLAKWLGRVLVSCTGQNVPVPTLCHVPANLSTSCGWFAQFE